MKEVFIEVPLKSLQWKFLHVRVLVFFGLNSPKFFNVKSISSKILQGRRPWLLTA